MGDLRSPAFCVGTRGLISAFIKPKENERVERSASQLFGHVGVSHIRCELEMCRKADVITEEPEFQSGMVKAINLKVKRRFFSGAGFGV